jgi:hypothetical protein
MCSFRRKTVRSNSAHISQLPRIAPIDVDETTEDENKVSWQSKDCWSSENDEINLSSQSDAIIAHIDKRMDHLKQFFTIQLDQMRKQLGKLEQLAWEHFTAERRQVGKVEQLVREQFATFTAERRVKGGNQPYAEGPLDSGGGLDQCVRPVEFSLGRGCDNPMPFRKKKKKQKKKKKKKGGGLA